MNTSIREMYRTMDLRDQLADEAAAKLTRREELEVKIKARMMVIEATKDFPHMREAAEKELAELEEELKKLDEKQA